MASGKVDALKKAWTRIFSDVGAGDQTLGVSLSDFKEIMIAPRTYSNQNIMMPSVLPMDFFAAGNNLYVTEIINGTESYAVISYKEDTKVTVTKGGIISGVTAFVR